MKNNLLCTPNKHILWLSKTYDGSVHDKRITDEQPLTFPAGLVLWQEGHSPAKVTVKMPTKKPKGKPLSDDQKQKNKATASFRILVEHAIGGIKKCRIVKERFRCRKLGFDDLVMTLAYGLHNFRITISLKLNHI